jgi:hypothetical protein
MISALAATLVAPRRLEVREYPYPSALEPGAVLLRMLASGIRGTDKHTQLADLSVGAARVRRLVAALYLKPGTAMFRVPEGLPDEIAVLTGKGADHAGAGMSGGVD